MTVEITTTKMCWKSQCNLKCASDHQLVTADQFYSLFVFLKFLWCLLIVVQGCKGLVVAFTSKYYQPKLSPSREKSYMLNHQTSIYRAKGLVILIYVFILICFLNSRLRN